MRKAKFLSADVDTQVPWRGQGCPARTTSAGQLAHRSRPHEKTPMAPGLCLTLFGSKRAPCCLDTASHLQCAVQLISPTLGTISMHLPVLLV